MLLKPEESENRDKYQKIIVSRETGENREHRAINPDGIYEVRHYQLDGKLVRNQTCCDYLLLNDTRRKAYYIELKGKDVKKAVDQVLAGEKLCREELQGYLSYYRIVTSRSPTHNNAPKNLRNLQDRYGTKRVICKTRKIEEVLD